MSVLSEDDAGEWATFFPPGTDSENVIGFVMLGYPPLYHRIFLAPDVYSAFNSWFSAGTPPGNEYAFSVAAMTLIHESFHWRLVSGDESTVNACALKYFSYYLARDFDVPETVTQTTIQEVPVATTTRVPVTHLKSHQAPSKSERDVGHPNAADNGHHIQDPNRDQLRVTSGHDNRRELALPDARRGRLGLLHTPAAPLQRRDLQRLIPDD
jgi:flagellar basal body rod protein FlgC